MKIKLDHSSSIPLHVQIVEQLRALIKNEKLRKGTRLPNEIDLAKQLGISRSTLRQSINKLVSEGLVTRKKGVGTFVTRNSIISRAQNWLSFSQEMKTLGIEPKNYELHISWVKPDEELCLFFDIKEDTRVLKLERSRGNQEYPFVYFISYFNPRIGLTGNEDFSRPLYEILEQEYNYIAKLSKEEISAIGADTVLSEKLDIKIGSPILKRKRFVYDPGDRPLEWNIGYYKSDNFTYTLELINF